MRYEKTKTYIRWHIGPLMIQLNWNTDSRVKRRSTKTICHMINITHKLTNDDKRQYRDYLNAVLKDEEHGPV